MTDVSTIAPAKRVSWNKISIKVAGKPSQRSSQREFRTETNGRVSAKGPPAEALVSQGGFGFNPHSGHHSERSIRRPARGPVTCAD